MLATPSSVAGAGAGPGTGAAGAESPASCGKVTERAELTFGPVDILWIIDGSGSMAEENMAVQQNLDSFANTIGNAGIDHHVILVARTDLAAMTPLGMDAARYRFVQAQVKSSNGYALLLSTFPQYSSFLRPNAVMHFVVVSDDDDDIAADVFRAQMEQLLGKKFIFHAIASEDVNGQPCTIACGLPFGCGGGARIGKQHYANAQATGGQQISICTTDWSQVFGPLQKAVIASAPLPCDYPIPAPPSLETLDPDRVNFEYAGPMQMPAKTFPRASSMAACASNLAWYYDDPAVPKQIKLCPAGCEAIRGGGTVQIELGCQIKTVVLD